jgi:hypothetical protein
VLLDTGSTLSGLISYSQAHALKCTTYMQTNFDLHTLHGVSKIDKYCLLNLQIHYKRISIILKAVKFHIVDDLPFPYIIGMPTIRAYNLTRTFSSYFTNVEIFVPKSEISRSTHTSNERATEYGFMLKMRRKPHSML